MNGLYEGRVSIADGSELRLWEGEHQPEYINASP